ncbi:helix-turn-helix transcriptional regulator [Sphingomonas sp.]|uniref:helix-turn-helix domain-containing protein n=1 Tax=Sphingomonas sp. TaxID=28214 RepID=UPI001EB5811F|nr:helix-turn-helix transcriptional regulator [Sphingomonas sp.]MBX3593097.1 helix-turn-helix domain-containing protein [Sphingomonas sp.]
MDAVTEMSLPYEEAEMPISPRGSVSRLLRDARDVVRRSIEDVAGEIRFPASFLTAIEEGAFEEFAAPIYLFGAVRAYARAVGVDEAAAIAAVRAALADRGAVAWRRQGWIS